MDDVHYLFGSVGLFVAAIMNEFWEDMDVVIEHVWTVVVTPKRMRINGITYEFH